MIAVLTIISIVLMYLAMSCVYYKKDAIELAVLAVSYFLFAYILGSGLLFWLDIFSIINGVVISIVMGVLFNAYLLLVIKKKPTISYDYRKSIIPLIIFIIVLPVSFSKFGYFGMGQDQGVYQTKALELIYGNNSNVVDFDEFDDLDVEMDIATFKGDVGDNLLGYYVYDPKVPSLNQEDYKGVLSGVFHGIPTFAAILALYGSIFGYSHMSGVQTIIFFCAIFLMYYIARNLKIKKFLAMLATFMFAISPIVLWSSKSALTEMFIAVIILMYIFILTDEEHKTFAWLSFVPIAVFSFYHITIYTVMPMFFITYIGLYFTTKDKQCSGQMRVHF